MSHLQDGQGLSPEQIRAMAAATRSVMPRIHDKRGPFSLCAARVANNTSPFTQVFSLKGARVLPDMLARKTMMRLSHSRAPEQDIETVEALSLRNSFVIVAIENEIKGITEIFSTLNRKTGSLRNVFDWLSQQPTTGDGL